MSDAILYADAHLFPPTSEDFEQAERAGYTLVAINGHRPADFARHGENAVGLLAYGGAFGAEVFGLLPNLRVLARCGAGYDNIDLRAAESAHIIVTYVPGASDHEVAEHTVALLLGSARKISASDREVRLGKWPSSAELTPMIRVHGSTLGLVGFGRIARAVAAKCQGLGMSVTAFDPYVEATVLAAAGVAATSSLPELLAESDFVSLHLPGGADRAVIGAAELEVMRPTAILLNTARGSLVDTQALVLALQCGAIAGAALDVLDPEPVPPDHPILALDNVVITPHSAAFSRTALASLRSRAIYEALTVLSGRPPITPVPRKN